MGWGIAPWGLGSWGFGSVAVGSLYSAFAISTHRVRVYLTADVAARSSINVGDALNPDTWLLQTLNSDDSVRSEFTVLQVVAIDAARGFDLYTAEPLLNWHVRHRVTAVGLLTPTGVEIIAPRYLDFVGVALPASSALAQGVDLREDAYVATGIPATSGGDYATHGGKELLRKMVVRRLTTSTGAFFHLDSFGLGIRVKEPVRSGGDLVRLKVAIEAQLAQEPDVVSAKATLSLTALGVLNIQLMIRMQHTDEEVPVDFEAPTGEG